MSQEDRAAIASPPSTAESGFVHARRIGDPATRCPTCGVSVRILEEKPFVFEEDAPDDAPHVDPVAGDGLVHWGVPRGIVAYVLRPALEALRAIKEDVFTTGKVTGRSQSAGDDAIRFLETAIHELTGESAWTPAPDASRSRQEGSL